MKQITDTNIYIPETCEAFENRTIYEVEDYRFAIEHAKGFSVAIEVGAHVGIWTQQLCNKFDRVIAFEAFEDVYDCLQENVSRCNNLEHHGLAVGPRFGYCYLESKENDSGSGKVVRIMTDHEVTMIALDDFLHPGENGGLDKDLEFEESVDFIKIDVNGYEAYVLDGAIETIKLYRPTLFIRVDNEDDDRVDDVLLPLRYKNTDRINDYYVWQYDDNF
jgi:FkbM family methyltransferase